RFRGMCRAQVLQGVLVAALCGVEKTEALMRKRVLAAELERLKVALFGEACATFLQKRLRLAHGSGCAFRAPAAVGAFRKRCDECLQHCRARVRRMTCPGCATGADVLRGPLRYDI